MTWIATQRSHLDAVHDALDDRADLVWCTLERNERSSEGGRDPHIVLRLDLDVPLNARHDLQPLILDDRQLTLLRPAQAILELVEHRSNSSLCRLDCEAAGLGARHIDLSAQGRDSGGGELAVKHEGLQEVEALAVDARERERHFVIGRWGICLEERERLLAELGR